LASRWFGISTHRLDCRAHVRAGLDEQTFVERKCPNPYIYKPEQELITKDFPTKLQLQQLFPNARFEE
jgi:hypothetical protein